MSASDPDPTDDALLAFLDGEPNGSEEQIAAHLAGCSVCAANVERLRRRNALVEAGLRELDLEMPPVPPYAAVQHRQRVALWTTLRRTAGIAAALGGIALAVGPIRAAVVEWFSGDDRAPSAEAPLQPVAPRSTRPSPAPPAQATENPEVRFTPEGVEFEIAFAAAQRAGTLEVAYHSVPYATLQTIGGTAGDPFLVLPQKIRVQSTDLSRASYRLTLPQQVKRLRVVIGGHGRAVVLPQESPGKRLTVPLNAP